MANDLIARAIMALVSGAQPTPPRRPPMFESAAVGPFDESGFQDWYDDYARRGVPMVPDRDAPDAVYDYRAAYASGAKPDASGHWPSDFKRPGHEAYVVGGFNTRTGERVPGTRRAGYEELVRLGWEPETAAQLAATPER